MTKENAVLMQEARESLKGKWGLAVGVYFLYMLMMMVVNAVPGIGGLASIFISGPLAIGLATFSLALSRNQEASFSQLFGEFDRYGRALLAYVWVLLFTLLWSLLFIVPGIIAAFSYSQTFYLLSEDKSLGAKEAVKKSKAMMYGNKMKLFLLGLRFFGWLLLSILTLGIGLLWLIPYTNVTMAKFYEDISKSSPTAV